MAKLVIGTGYLGFRVAQRWREDNDPVFVTTRFAARADVLADKGLRPIVADVTDPVTLKDLPAVDTVLFSVGLDRKAGHSIDEVYVEGLANVLDAISGRTKRFIYISSSGVYGQEDGSWVDELSDCEPIRAGGRACLAAERGLAEHSLGRLSVILRLAGIYGPGRVPRRADLILGQPIVADGDGFLNLIHVEDAVSAVIAAGQIDDFPALYVVSDGSPVLRRHYFHEVARLMGIEDLRIETPPGDGTDSRRMRGDKRIDSSKLRRELGFSPHYPTFREGLAAIFASDAG